MSALLAVAKKDAVHLLTDAVACDVKNGVVSWIGRKQSILPERGIAIAGIGIPKASADIAALMEKHDVRFDDFAGVAPDLWDEMRAKHCAVVKAYPGAIAIAGYSEQAGRVVLHVYQEVDGQKTLRRDQTCYIGGPGDNAEPAKPFHARLMTDREAFDPLGDGLAFMEAMRRHSFKNFDVGPGPAVGGFVTHTVVRRDVITTQIARQWPDEVGKPINPDVVGSFSTLTWRDLNKEARCLEH